jgi:hypothetical protein
LLLLSQKATQGCEVELLGRLDNFCAGAGHFEGLVEEGTPQIKQANRAE